MTTLNLSVVILAGGESKRMGTDKALLKYRGQEFIKLISSEMLSISDEVIVTIGRKNVETFAQVLGGDVKIMQDAQYISNPVGGMISAGRKIAHSYCAFLGCDTPFVKKEVVKLIYQHAIGHSAAIPIWENGDLEPLCGVYDAKATIKAGQAALHKGKLGCKNLISFLPSPVYLKVEDLRKVDPELVSFKNVNTTEDYRSLFNP